MSDLILAHARVVDPSQRLDQVTDIAVKDGKFAAPEDASHPTVLNLDGKILTPGFIDVHVHLREPGQTHKEDIATATAAAAAGGFTTVLAMPNTAPAMDTPEKVREFYNLAAAKARVHVLQAGAITLDRAGKTPTDIPGLVAAGCPAVSDDGSTPQSEDTMRQIMATAAAAGVPVIDHCEDTRLSKPGVMHRGAVSDMLGLPGQPREAELAIVRRDLRLAKETGCRIHLQHISCGESLKLLAEAREQGIQATAEVTPHHLLLTHLDCIKYGVNAKMAPPLREESDRQALIQAMADGIVDMIATDHAPHTAAEKALGWLKAPFGITGIETVVPLLMTHFVHTGVISLYRLVEMLTLGPRNLLGLQAGTLAFGAPADFTVLDPDAEFAIRAEDLHSKSANCPWLGWKVRGRVVCTSLGTQD